MAITPEFTTQFVGVPVNQIVAAVLGTAASFGVPNGYRPKERAEMWMLAMCCVVMGCGLTVLVNEGLEVWRGKVLLQGSRAGMTVVISFLARFFLPWVTDVVSTGKWVKWVPFLNKSEGS